MICTNKKCNKRFIRIHHSQKYCTRECNRKASKLRDYYRDRQNNKPRKRNFNTNKLSTVKRKCCFCKLYYLPKSNHQKFCSIKCRDKDKKTKSYTYENRKKNGLCVECGKVSANKVRCKSCRLKKSHYQKLHLRKTKQKLIDTYGGKCVCCKEKIFEFLSLDHVNGDGSKERNIMKTSLYLKAIREKGSGKYRLLCMNCNTSLGFYGYCPHQFNKEMK